MYITGDLLGENEYSSVIKLHKCLLFVGINSSICFGEGPGVMYITGDLLGENESSSTNILQSWTHRKGSLALLVIV